VSYEWTVAELELASLAIALGGLEAGGSLSATEARLAEAAATRPPPARRDVLETAEQVRVGDDPLGDRLVSVRPPSERRTLGQVLTPASIAAPMVEWVLDRRASRVVDASNGSGRFTLGIARRSAAEVIAVDADPLATLLTRAGIAARGCDRRASVLNADYLRWRCRPTRGSPPSSGTPRTSGTTTSPPG